MDVLEEPKIIPTESLEKLVEIAPPSPEVRDPTPKLESPLKKSKVFDLRHSLASLGNTDETTDGIMSLPACLVLDELYDVPEAQDEEDLTIKIEKKVESLNLVIPPAKITDKPTDDEPVRPELMRGIEGFGTELTKNKPQDTNEEKEGPESDDLDFDEESDSIDPNHMQEINPTSVQIIAGDKSLSLDADKSIEQDIKKSSSHVLTKDRVSKRGSVLQLKNDPQNENLDLSDKLEDLIDFEDEDSVDVNALV